VYDGGRTLPVPEEVSDIPPAATSGDVAELVSETAVVTVAVITGESMTATSYGGG